MKWFAGGQDRGKQVSVLINELLNELNDSRNIQLKHILIDYKDKLNKQQASVPFLLSQLNIEMAKAIQHDSSELSLKQKDIIKKITSLSNIRYGY
ncbi:TPA: bacteriocin immunity protein [Enterococcus faecalis]|uniref:Bacteriocin immunity protein n=2 Tax=Enterococcus TaxID=1350 RepID=A0AAW7KD14_ENTFL|nr:bacteriocin immunity protein [Enterococcus faecalis]EGO8494459.1 bacteriocin immunity protein [Enterococcus faecalis]MBD9927635.1 bacteriocin immunity protein [Enterococcus faecalis]MDN3074353.1 bacteriocin immunity protein [Enterococcus faecalis]MDN3095807.1 bacteriocin immunity protein [Enterococcus faecalis]MDN3125990.1 bacteriocin immunity protein [Enterococcus faecalis]